jgi:mRNA interferase MazF
MLRGEIRLVDLGSGFSGEAAKRRPAVIVSNDGANTTAARLGRGVLTIVPVTSNTDRMYPFQALIPPEASGLEQDSKAQAEQVRAVSINRIGEQVGQADAQLMLKIDDALRIHLEL